MKNLIFLIFIVPLLAGCASSSNAIRATDLEPIGIHAASAQEHTQKAIASADLIWEQGTPAGSPATMELKTELSDAYADEAAIIAAKEVAEKDNAAQVAKGNGIIGTQAASITRLQGSTVRWAYLATACIGLGALVFALAPLARLAWAPLLVIPALVFQIAAPIVVMGIFLAVGRLVLVHLL